MTRNEIARNVLANIAFSIRGRGAYKANTRSPLYPVLMQLNASVHAESFGSDGLAGIAEAKESIREHLANY